MRLLDFGSLNIDHTYHLSHFVRAGETLSCEDYSRSEGGKGLNQAVALAKAGLKVEMAGAIGRDGQFLLKILQEAGVGTSLVRELDCQTGHALIQVDAQGANCIIINSGANGRITEYMIDETLTLFQPGDYVLLQNEISGVAEIMIRARRRGMKVILNPSPVSENMKEWPMELVDWFLINEIEGADLTNSTDPETILDRLLARYPESRIVLTLGEKGAFYADGARRVYQPAVPVKAIDTTAAGDTFTGYFLASILSGKDVEEALKRAAIAASVAISRRGASQSVPYASELQM